MVTKTDPGMETIIEAAEALTYGGLYVLPVGGTDGKKPFGGNEAAKGWQHRAANDPEAVADLFGACPEATGVGVLLGPASNLVDVEIDAETEVERAHAEHQLAELCGGDPPVAPTFKSARGKHRLFRWSAELPNKAAHHVGNIEVRIGAADKGSQSVFPPSGGREWLPGCSTEEIDSPELPSGIINAVKAAVSPQNNGHGPVKLGETIPEGQRNQTLFAVGCSFRSRGMDNREILAALQVINRSRGRPPLPDGRLRGRCTACAADGEAWWRRAPDGDC